MCPCRRFALPLAGQNARLGGDMTRYVFIVEDLHLLLLASIPAHYQWPLTLTVARSSGPGLSGPPPPWCPTGGPDEPHARYYYSRVSALPLLGGNPAW